MRETAWTETAARVEAIGAISAVIGAAWVAASESRASRRREDRAHQEGLRKEERAILATKTAALNLAILAATQIHDVNIALRDEAWRGRITRVSPSLTLLATEHMLIAFPIQSPADAASMVEFSRFPSALATAAEVYANLETAVRAAAPAQHAAIFAAYMEQMERVDGMAKRALSGLRNALRFGPGETPDVAAALEPPVTALPPGRTDGPITPP
jgi:hypothetical protein